MTKKRLDNVTLICVDCYSYGKAVNALQKSLEQIEPARTVFITDIDLDVDGIEVIKIRRIASKKEYSYFIVKELYKYFETDYCLVIQHDGYVLSGECWDDKFLQFDYVGAPWLYVDGRNVGNGGCSIRSKRLQIILGTDETITTYHHEDDAICRLYRPYLEDKYNIRFADEEIADKFSFELREPKRKTFAFHGYFHPPYKPTVILKRSAAIGDVILIEPVMRYFFRKGYNIVLDIPQEWMSIFSGHYFPIKHISNFDKGRIPAKEINLDLAYEVKPKQNYTKSYFEFCGITDYVLSKPILAPVERELKLFKKYAVIHIDYRITPYRNIYDVKWDRVRKHLESLEYTVIQVGANEHENCGIEINTLGNVGFLKYIVGGCDLFLGVDSAPSHMAVATNRKCIIFFGSVNPDYVHADLTNVEVLQGNCDNAYCWHQVGGTSGTPCKYAGTDKYLQCCTHDYEEVIGAINRIEEIKQVEEIKKLI